jgi:2-polyprenyl-3-methyl-5-hydroxy-6-metoxy-1,4-benzoquinol methylase
VTKNFGPDAYNELYAYDYWGRNDLATIPYRRLFRRVANIARQNSINNILEVGCGSGVLAEILIKSGVSYRGFDFNPIAVEQARKRNGADKHYVADATDPTSYPNNYDGIMCCEVLEHISEDLQTIRLWKPGTVCVCSVPSFDYSTHVRFFRDEGEVIERYSKLLNIEKIERLAKSPAAVLTWPEYFRHLRWARNNPKRFAALLGLNQFNWHGGWFIFTSTRR